MASVTKTDFTQWGAVLSYLEQQGEKKKEKKIKEAAKLFKERAKEMKRETKPSDDESSTTSSDSGDEGESKGQEEKEKDKDEKKDEKQKGDGAEEEKEDGEASGSDAEPEEPASVPDPNRIKCHLNCGADFATQEELDEHADTACPWRTFICEICQQEFYTETEGDHDAECPEAVVECPNGCGEENLKRKQLMHHLESCLAYISRPTTRSTTGISMLESISEDEELDLELKAKGDDVMATIVQLRYELLTDFVDLSKRDNVRAKLAIIREAIDTNQALVERAKVKHERQASKLRRLCLKMNRVYSQHGASLLWKITEFQEHYTKAESNEKPIIFSPPFLTSKYGYKLAASVCLYGNGPAIGYYMSLFITICRGEYDHLLNWPFGLPITFTLLDQSDTDKKPQHLSYTLAPIVCPENTKFLGRPTSGRNASFGITKFVDLKKLTGKESVYAREDTIYIKIEVNIESSEIIGEEDLYPEVRHTTHDAGSADADPTAVSVEKTEQLAEDVEESTDL